MKSHGHREMLHLHAWQCFGKRVSSLFVGRAVDQLDSSGIDDVADEMVADVDVFGACVILFRVHERDG